MAEPPERAALPEHSLEDIHGSVAIPAIWWRRFLAFSGPALLISVGYMDPGNWATDLKAGSKYEYRLLWVLLMSNLMALLLQSLATRLGVVTGRDLAQACRESYPRPAVWGLWILCEIAIAATDLAEVIGTIIALKLLFGLPYFWGLVIAAGDTFLLLALQRRGVRLLELLTLALVAIIGVSFFIEIALQRPDWAAVAWGLLPGLPHHYVLDSLIVSIGMLGATVMPHNLYFHSALVQTRAFPQTSAGKRLACRYNLFDSLLALNLAFLVNAAILILAAAVFFNRDSFDQGIPVAGVERLDEAHHLLGQKMEGVQVVGGVTLAAALFAVALLASGQSSTLTGTLAGQVVMEGFVRLRLRPWLRRLATRSLAIVPALLVLAFSTSDSVAGSDERDALLMNLVVISQVVLSFQLPFAIVPLVQFTSDRQRMGEFASRSWLKVLAWICVAIVVVFNGVATVLQAGEWADAVTKADGEPLWIYLPITLLSVAAGAFLGWVTLYPFLVRRQVIARAVVVPPLRRIEYQRIGVAVELEGADDAVLVQATALARAQQAELVIMHIVEGTVANYYGAATDDQESRTDRVHMTELVEQLRKDGLSALGVLGYGSPAEELVRLATEQRVDLLVLGTHGHRFFADLALGQTVAPLLHRLTIPVLVVPTRSGPSS